MNTLAPDSLDNLVTRLKARGHELGFSQIGIADLDLSAAEPGLMEWIERGFHGQMHYFDRHGALRARPAQLQPGAVRVISARMDYLPRGQTQMAEEAARLLEPGAAVVSVYARGRDYHKILRTRLAELGAWLGRELSALQHTLDSRAFTDSAPILEVELAVRAGLGWRGKHTLLLSREAGSFFFIGELLVNCELPLDAPQTGHCGTCAQCIEVCPTGAIVAPYTLDARRCISYLTIEHEGVIDQALRPLLGNRIYGCDDCQLFCPWNKYAQAATEADFAPRNALDRASLLELWAWSAADFDERLKGSPIRRIGHERWQRNIATALGNALRDAPSETIRTALTQRLPEASPMLAEHIHWALAQSVGNP